MANAMARPNSAMAIAVLPIPIDAVRYVYVVENRVAPLSNLVCNDPSVQSVTGIGPPKENSRATAFTGSDTVPVMIRPEAVGPDLLCASARDFPSPLSWGSKLSNPILLAILPRKFLSTGTLETTIAGPRGSLWAFAARK